MAPLTYAVEIVAYDPALPGTRTLYYATRGFCSTPSDTPANTHFDERLQQPAVMRRDLFDALTTAGRSRTGYGDLVLANGDGALDALIGYGFDGRAITIRQGPPGAAYPSGYTTLLVGTMEQVEVGRETVTVKLRDRQAELNVPLQATKYAGDNALPDGLEGVETDLKGKPKPRCFGKVLNVPAVPVNTSKLIYQVNDGAIASLDAVYDRGVGLEAGRVWALNTVGTVSWQGVAWGSGAGVWVAIGLAGELYTSANGTTWTSRTSGFGTDPILGVAWSEALGLFVIVGFTGQLSTSPDGITWTARTSGFGTDTITCVGWNAGMALFVAAGAAGKVSTSTDGVTWTARTSGFGSSDIDAVASGIGLFVIVGQAGKIASSPDGITWTLRTSGVGVSATFTAAIYGNGVFFVGGQQAAEPLGASRSTDGITWIGVDNPLGSHTTLGLAYGTKFVALGLAGYVATSLDGVTWQVQAGDTVFGASDLKAIGYNADDNTYVGAGESGKIAEAAPGTYANATDLEDDALAPHAGEYIAYLAGGYFRLGAPPAGLITADVTQKPLTQLVSAPENFGAWTLVGSGTLTPTQADPLGGVTAYHFADADAGAATYLIKAFAIASATHTVRLAVKPDTAATMRVQVVNAGLTVRHGVLVTFNGADPPTLSTLSGSGVLFTPRALADGYWEIPFNADGVVSGDLLQILMGTTGTDTGSAWIHGANAWNDDRPHPYTGPSLNPSGLQTAANLFDAGLEIAGRGWADLNSADLFALDMANDAELGFWTHDEMTCAQLLNLAAGSIWAWWGVDRTGVYRIQQFTAPSGTPVQSFVANDILKTRPLTRITPNDPTRGLPSFQTIVRWGRVYAVQTTDLAGGVTAAHRALVGHEWREATDTDAAVQTIHLLAPQTVEDSLLTTEADAQTEAERRQTIRGTLRHLFTFGVGYDAETVERDLGEVVELTHARYGLSGGESFRVLSVEPDAAAERLGLTVWG
jgi:hypothetical protein